MKISTFLLTGLLTSQVIAAPKQDTVWWRTDGGNVTEHRSEKSRTCALWLYGKGDGNSISFTWQNDKPTLISAVTTAPLLSVDVIDPHAVLQIGDQPLGDPVPVQNLGTALLFTLNPIDNILLDERLRTADMVAVHTDKGDISLKLNPTKMWNLVSKAVQCRKANGGTG